MRVVKVFQWDAAHWLQLPYDSKCTHIHGHTYKVEVEFEGDINNHGMVVDFAALKNIVEKVSFDHKFINEDIPYFKMRNPTAENLVNFLYQQIEQHRPAGWPKLRRIRVWETPNSYAERVFDDDARLVLQSFKNAGDKLEQMNAAMEQANKKLERLTKKLR